MTRKPIPRIPRKNLQLQGTFPDKRHPKTGPKVKAVIAAIIKTNGMISKAAKILFCDVKTITNRMKENPQINEALEEAEAIRLDRAETMLDRNIKKGNQRAIEFYLLHKGKARGYGQELKRVEDDKNLASIIDAWQAALESTKPPLITEHSVVKVVPRSCQPKLKY